MQPGMELRKDVRVETCTGHAIVPLLPALQRLRVTVFRAWPYLYDGDVEQESAHLRAFVDSPLAAIVVAFGGGAPVGASTCLPLGDEAASVRAPFEAAGIDPELVFYFGESVLLPEWRGDGIGVAFFERREAHARRVSACGYTAFCAVDRPAGHPMRPPGAAGLDGFWRNRGYTPYPGLACTMRWKDVGQDAPSEHVLRFWLKSLRGAPLP